MLEKLSQNLALLTGNISNPFYVHYLFEALVAFVRISSVDPALCHDIETFLTPYMQDVVPPAPTSPPVFEPRRHRVHALHLPALRPGASCFAVSRVDAALAERH